MTTHVRIGHPGPAPSGGTTDAYFCYCACPACLAGSCCRGSSAWPVSITYPVDTTRWGNNTTPVYPTDKHGNSLVGYWECRCGTVVPPGAEHRCPPESPA